LRQDAVRVVAVRDDRAVRIHADQAAGATGASTATAGIEESEAAAARTGAPAETLRENAVGKRPECRKGCACAREDLGGARASRARTGAAGAHQPASAAPPPAVATLAQRANPRGVGRHDRSAHE